MPKLLEILEELGVAFHILPHLWPGQGVAGGLADQRGIQEALRVAKRAVNPFCQQRKDLAAKKTARSPRF